MASNPGSIKQDPATGRVALCTSLSGLDPDGDHNWMIHDEGMGAWYGTDEDISSYTDLYVA